MSTIALHPASPKGDDQAKILDEALNIVKVQSFHMKRCLDSNKLMDGLKHCSTMLSELRTSSLTPKNYYELYMSIFDELRFLTSFLYESHMNNKHHLSDLYELVQYAGNIVPRLYLMITVGSVYMRVSKETLAKQSDATSSVPESNHSASIASSKRPDDDEVPPIKELMKDMLEMSRGVQHPTRGLFLRYYLSGVTRDFLPDGVLDGPHGSMHDSIHFILQNFIEMNKLWVRLQHQGHSREKEKRELERKELRLLVGSNLVRLSQLESLDLEVYQKLVLPQILDEIVNCNDVIAQEYLMEVIIQVFPDDFHLRSLDPFLSATAKLQKNVNVKQIVISLIDRFSSYAARARDMALEENEEGQGTEERSKSPASSGIPSDVKLFDIFWNQVTDLIEARPEFSIQAIIALLASLTNLCLNCYPERLDYIDVILGYAKEKVLDARSKKIKDLYSPQTTKHLLSLLTAPIPIYKKNLLKSFLSFPSSATHSISESAAENSRCLGGNYTDLLFLQTFTIRRSVASLIASTIIKSGIQDGFRISSIDGINLIFGELCSCLIRDQVDGDLFGSNAITEDGNDGELTFKAADKEVFDWEDIVLEQEMVAKIVHLIEHGVEGFVGEAELDSEFMLLNTSRKHFGEGGGLRIRFTLPPLVMSCIKLARKYGHIQKRSVYATLNENVDIKEKLNNLYKFIHQTISTLGKARENYNEEEQRESLFGDHQQQKVTDKNAAAGKGKIGYGLMSPPEMALRLFLLSAQISDETEFEELCYEFFVQAFSIYEDSISESKAQSEAISLIMGTLYYTKVFGFENYETLITKILVHSSRLLKRVDQCRGIILASHLYWSHDTGDNQRNESKPGYRDGKKVLECMQKALKIADSVMDKDVSVDLFVDVLERCCWFYEKRNDTITIKYINSLIELIQTNLTSIPNISISKPQYQHPIATIPHYGPVSHVIPQLFSDNSDGGDNKEIGKTVSDVVMRHFKNVVYSLQFKREEEANSVDGGFSRIWSDVEV